MISDILESLLDGLIEDILLQDEVIRRGDDDISIRVLGLDVVGSPSDTRSCIPSHRLE